MTVVTISRGTYSKGKEIAEEAGTRLGFECISREVLLDTSEMFHVPELKLARAVHDAPRLLERLGHRKESYVAFIRVALLRRLRADSVIYHGLAGHFFVRGIPHALKVRVIADMEDRVRLEMQRNALPEAEARQILERDDEQRRGWSVSLYGTDTCDPHLYDIVLNVSSLGVEAAVDLVCHAARLDRFATTAGSGAAMDEQLLDAEVRAALIEISHDLEPHIEGGVVHVRSRIEHNLTDSLRSRVEKTLASIRGVKEVRFGAADSAYSNPWHKI